MKYGLTPDEWDAAKVEIREMMIAVAKLRTTITYSEMTAQMLTINPHPGSYVFHALLRDVCVAEREAERGMLCAVVVSKATGLPGQGFFKAMIKNGHDCSDIQRCWKIEIERLYDIWGD